MTAFEEEALQDLRMAEHRYKVACDIARTEKKCPMPGPYASRGNEIGNKDAFRERSDHVIEWKAKIVVFDHRLGDPESTAAFIARACNELFARESQA